MDNKIAIPNEVIVDKIYFIREQKTGTTFKIPRCYWNLEFKDLEFN